MTADELAALAASGAPLTDQRTALARALAQRGVGAESIARLMEHVRDGIALTAADGECRSRLGGPGMLPRGEPWPRDPNGAPLTLVAVLDLAELPPLDPLPADGTLALFWDFMFHDLEKMDFVAGTRVFWLRDGEEAREEHPPDGADPGELESVPVRGMAMPVAGEQRKVEAALKGAPDVEELFDAMEELTFHRHQLLGSSRDIQGPVLDEVPYWFRHVYPETEARFSDDERAGDWILLAQIEEDPQVPSLFIGDAGSIYFVMLESDLRERRFDRVMGIMQCH